MIGNLFKKATADDLLRELNNKIFNEPKITSLLKGINLKQKFADGENFLHKIIPHNNIESVKILIKQGIDLNIKNPMGDTALIIAARTNYLDTLDVLINAGANVNISNDDNRLAIQEAIINCHYGNYLTLIQKTKNLNHKDKNGQTLLHDAINSSNIEILKDLLTKRALKAEKNILIYPKLYDKLDIFSLIVKSFENINITDKEGKNLLFHLVRSNFSNFEKLEYLLKLGIDVNCIDNNGDTILIYLIKHVLLCLQDKEEIDTKIIQSLIEFIPRLIEEGIDLTVCNHDDENILTLPIKAASKDIIKILLEGNTNPNLITKKMQSGLSLAAMQGNDSIDIIYLLLDYGASPNLKDSNNQTIIEKLLDIELFKRNGKELKSSKRGILNEKNDYLVILKTILAHSQVQLTQLNSKKEPYIFEPISYGNFDLIKLLLKYGADINQTNSDGSNILYKYMEENKTFHKDIDQRNYYINLKNIIGMGANVNTKDSHGGITLHKAILECDLQTVKILIHSGADINAVDDRGRNMIHNCMWQNKIQLFKFIYSYNRKLLNQTDKFGVLPINYAAFLGYTDLVLRLIQTGSHVNNPSKKTHYILNFLKKFHKNITILEKQILDKSDRNRLNELIQNMKQEFKININSSD